MKVQVTQENLSSALQSISRVAGKNSSLPIIGNVLLRTIKNRLLVSATNLEAAISERIGAKVVEEGDITVPARLLTELVSSLPNGNIELTVENYSLHLSGATNSTVHGISADDFPSIPDISGEAALSLDAHEIKQAISEVAVTASSDETRPVLTGVVLKADNNKLKMAATDSYRLAEKIITLKANAKDFNVIVPARSLTELQRLISDTSENLDIFIDEGQIKFVLDEKELISRLVEGNYPEYEQLIPSDNKTSFVVEKSKLIQAAKTTSIFARDSSGSVTLSVKKQSSTIDLSAVAAQVGDHTSTVDVEKATNNDQVTFNVRYLIDALQIFPAQKIEFSFNGKLAPCLLRSADSKPEEYTHIIMPLRS